MNNRNAEQSENSPPEQPNEERRYLAVYRHAQTKKGTDRGQGSHLSREGVTLARQIGQYLQSFHKVYVSPYPRTLETALAMGFAVDDILEFSCGYVLGEFAHHEQWTWKQPYVRFAQMLRSETRLAELALLDRQLWINLLLAVPAGGRVLIVSHGGSIEPTLVACLPEAQHELWDSPFSHGDGALLTFASSGSTGEQGRFTDVEFQRASRLLRRRERAEPDVETPSSF